MKIVQALALGLFAASAFAAGNTTTAPANTKAPAVKVAKADKEAKKAAKKACKDEGKTGKDLKSCVKEKLAAPAAPQNNG